MIFFIVLKRDKPDKSSRFVIPLTEEDEIKVNSDSQIQLVAWNQAICGSSNIATAEDLWRAVYCAAIKDPVCLDYNNQFFRLYSIDILAAFFDRNGIIKKGSEYYYLFETVLKAWPHPMIGNLKMSPGIRPQNYMDQYIHNWVKFPDTYMSSTTKQCIRDMLHGLSSCGLADLEKTGRDQVRICKSFTDLARAAIGEITSYASKKLEKIYALELCSSVGLRREQEKLITALVAAGKINQAVFCDKHRSIKTTEYIYFFFESLDSLSLEYQWTAFAKMITLFLIPPTSLDFTEAADRSSKKIIDDALDEFKKFPPTMQGAMIINAIRKFNASVVLKRYSITISKGFPPPELGRFSIPVCEVRDAASKSFIPELQTRGPKILLWNWMRDENHIATKTYRHFLMPLWAGPSGHTTGIIGFCFNSLYRPDQHDWTNERISRIVCSSMFAFWRLYYDKRICAVHSMAETFEAAYSEIFRNIALTNTKINHQNSLMLTARIAYDDAFDALAGDNIYNSIYIMMLIRNMHYTAGAGIKGLDTVIDGLRSRLAAQYFIPTWSKPIVLATSTNTVSESDLIAFRGIRISKQVVLNVKSFEPKPEDKAARFAAEAPSERIIKLYNTIKASDEYNFSQDFSELPKCYVDNKEAAFLEGITFTQIKSCEIIGSALTFAAAVSTGAAFWKIIKRYVKINGSEAIICKVTDDENGFNFTGAISVSSESVLTEILPLQLDRLELISGLDAASLNPCMNILSYVSDGTDTIELSVSIPFCNSSVNICGEYTDGKVLTITKLLTLFGLDTSMAESILPDDEAVFGALGLRSAEISLTSDCSEVNSVGFVITAENQWNIFDNKITLQPYFEIEIDYPFSSKKLGIFCTVMGKWHIGETEFDITVTSEGCIYAALAQGSVLNFAEVAKIFAEGISFPEIKFSALSFTANISASDYILDIGADEFFNFTVGSASVAIKDVMFRVEFFSGSFNELAFAGSVSLGGLTLTLEGSYSADDSFYFAAEVFNDTDYCLRDFAVQLASDLCTSFDESSVPEEFLTVNIRKFRASYKSAGSVFTAFVDLDNVLKITDDFSIDELKLNVRCSGGNSPEFEIAAYVTLYGNLITMVLSRVDNKFIIEGGVVFANCTFKDIAQDMGINIDMLPQFIADFAVEKLTLKYNFTPKYFMAEVVTSIGTVCAEVTSGASAGWRFFYKTAPEIIIDVLDMPVAGELIKVAAPDTSDFSIKNFEALVSSAKGIQFKCVAFGSECTANVHTPGSALKSVSVSSDAIIKWIEFNKTFSVLTLIKAGIGLDQSKVVFLLDASVCVTPMTFILSGAGIGVNLSDPTDFSFYISGFGIFFDNGALSIGGSFSITEKSGKTVYSGMLILKFKELGITAVGEYSSGSIMAYAAICAPIGGVPAFFVNGLSAGFGCNKRLILPPIEKVNDYPLIIAAVKGFTPNTLSELDKYIVDESGQNFLAAGIKFTSFELLNGFILATVSFGNDTEIALLGLADISIPPKVSANPIAKAQLAIKAAVMPSAGVVSVEAQLTSESFILSKSCKLTGGFAAYIWFGSNAHSGDFVVTLGGYHPAYKKPGHYPVVPRLGLNWNINSNLNISGEIYFALTPSSFMAGGRLNAVYTMGNLKAWFIAYADILMNWKPFAYDISLGVSLGASYRVDFWLIHKTFSIELSAALHIWGPEVQGSIRISWFIISFTISFSEGNDYSKETLDWNGFKESFLLDTSNTAGEAAENEIITVTLYGIIGQTADKTDIVSSEGLTISLVSKIPESGNVRPLNGAVLSSQISMSIVTENQNGTKSADDKFVTEKLTQNLPAAMWKTEPGSKSEKLNEEGVVKDMVCGIAGKASEHQPLLFPQTRYISLDELYKKNTLIYNDCFSFSAEIKMNLSDEDSINKFTENENAATAQRRKKYLEDNGITENVSISLLAENAENLFSENILINYD